MTTATNKDVLDAIESMESRLHTKIDTMSTDLGKVQGRLDTHIEVQKQKCRHAETAQNALKDTVFGKGEEPGLKLRHNTLATQVKVVAGILTIVTGAALASIGGWVLYLIETFDKVPKK
jgi:hypothetical protein